LGSWGHRICSAFKPDTSYERDSPTIPAEERFSWFGKRLEEGILYVFPYNQPSAVEEMKELSGEA
jgi:hypothetical protein